MKRLRFSAALIRGWRCIAGDWLNQRDDSFQTHTPIGDKSENNKIFTLHSSGLKTSRDSWCYNFSRTAVQTNMTAMIATYTQVSKDDIFYYTYAVLHSPQYRERYAADLKRMLPRIPLAAGREDFEAFTAAGRALSDLHTGYETVEPYPLTEQTQTPATPIDDWALYRVEKMRWVDKTTKRAIRFNDHIILGDIPDTADRYKLGSRSALEWLIDRYQVKTDKASQLVNDPNDWAREHNDPRYIIDLVKRVTRVSVETMTIVDGLSTLPLT